MKWFSFQAKAENTVEISIFDEIGMWGVSAKSFITELKSHAGKAITLCINSPGGSVFDALAMYNALRAHGSEIHVKVMGVAASAASLVAMAGDKITMPENAFMMVHNPMSGVYGNADEMRDVADVLDKIGASLIGIYAARTGKTAEEVKVLLDDESYLTANEALALGFATEVTTEMKIAASFDPSRLPENIRSVYEASSKTDEIEPPTDPIDPPTEPIEHPAEHPNTLAADVQAAADILGMGTYAATATFHASVKTLDDAKAFLANAREVIALCALAKKPEMATELVNSGVPAIEARVKLSDALAADDEATHTSNIQKALNQSTASGAGVWAKIFPPPQQSKE